MPRWIIGYTDEKDFDIIKDRYNSALKNQYVSLRKTICPLIGKPCIGCDCTAYNEPILPWKSLTGEFKLEQMWANIFNKPFTEPYWIHMELATCNKNIFTKSINHYLPEEERI